LTRSKRGEQVGRDRASLREVRSLNESQRWLVAWYWLAVTLSILFVLATPLRWYHPDFLPGIVRQMRLTEENNLAAWWSGVLLLMLAVHAYDARLASLNSSPHVERAWTILACILLFFSADEVGSIHERLSILGSNVGVGDWGLLIPLGAVLGAFLLRALHIFWKAGGEHRRRVWLLILGFGTLGSVAIQEVIEHAVEWGTGPGVWIRAVVEEGTELLGMIILLGVLLRPAMVVASRAQPPERRLFNVFDRHPRAISLALFGMIPLFTVLGHLIEDERGRLSSWLAVVALVLAALQPLSRVMSGESGKSTRWLPAAALCIAASMVPMWFNPSALTAVSGFWVSTPLLVMIVVCLLIFGTLRVTGARHLHNLGLYILLFSVWTALALGLSGTATHTVLVTQLLALLTLVVCYMAVEERGFEKLLAS
jgi:hypothetical protein